MKRRVLNIVITGAIIIVSFVLQSYLSLVSGQSFVVPNLLLIVTSIFGFIKGAMKNDPSLSLGNLYEKTLVDLWKSEKRLYLKQQLSN